MVPNDGVRNLLVTGRSIGDQTSHAAVRNMMCCTVAGQGAGVAAAVAVRTGAASPRSTSPQCRRTQAAGRAAVVITLTQLAVVVVNQSIDAARLGRRPSSRSSGCGPCRGVYRLPSAGLEEAATPRPGRLRRSDAVPLNQSGPTVAAREIDGHGGELEPNYGLEPAVPGASALPDVSARYPPEKRRLRTAQAEPSQQQPRRRSSLNAPTDASNWPRSRCVSPLSIDHHEAPSVSPLGSSTGPRGRSH